MRSLNGPIWDIWQQGGPYLGQDRSHGRVTIEFGWQLRASTPAENDQLAAAGYPARKLPIRWFQRADNSQTETELPNVKTIEISRTIDQDAATCAITVYNQQMLPQGLLELGNPGYFTPGRGSHADAQARWGHTANEWSSEIGPNALVRTYQGYGGYNPDGTPMDIGVAVALGHLVLTGVWLIDQVQPETTGMLTIRCRDMAKLLIEQPIYPPLVRPITDGGVYPLDYARFWYDDTVYPYVPYGTDAQGTKYIVGAEEAIYPGYENTPTDPVARMGDGYWLVGDDGGVFAYGDNVFYGSLSGDVIHDIIGIARTPTGNGYWVAAKDGTTFAFGDATWHGGTTPPAGQIIAIERAGTNDGYYLMGTSGDVYPQGAATYYGGSPLGSSQLVAMAVMPDGTGYWLLNQDGGVYAYGAAQYLGNGDPAVGPFAAIESTPTGQGYYVVSKKGHVYAFGDATYRGGAQDIKLNDPITDIVVRQDGAGYWLVAEDGGVFTYGNIPFLGALPGEFIDDRPHDGNYFDYVDIVKELLLWAGFWDYDHAAGYPDVFGNLESTGAYDPAPWSADTIDKQPIIAILTKIREIVAYLTWVDSIGAFHFESPNWWKEGNYLPDGTHTDTLPQIDEKVQLVSYGVLFDGQYAKSRIIIGNSDPYLGAATLQQTLNPTPPDPNFPNDPTYTFQHVTTDVPSPSVDDTRGLLMPVLWTNEVFTDQKDQETMAELLGRQLTYRRRIGSVQCWANPLIEINDQARIWERQTDEVYDHYVRGIDSSHDLDTGEYTMRLTTHWLGRDWSGPGPRRNLNIGYIGSAEAFGGVSDIIQTEPPIGAVVSAEAFGLPSTSVTAPMATVPASEGYGLARVALTDSVYPPGITSSEALGAPTISVGPTSGHPAGATTAEAEGQPNVILMLQLRSVSGIATAEAIGAAQANYISPVGVATQEAVGAPQPTTLLFYDDFNDLSQWTPGDFTISPASYAYDNGNTTSNGIGLGTGGALHTMEAGAAYVEALAFADLPLTNRLFFLKFASSGGAATQVDGVGVMVRQSNGAVTWQLAAGYTVTWTDPTWTGSVPRPSDQSSAVLIGIHKTGPGTYDLWVNRKKVQSVSGVTGDTGSYIQIVGYNGVGVHYDYVAVATDVLTSRPTPPMNVAIGGVASAEAVGQPSVSVATPTVLFMDDFVDLTNWSPGAFSINPAGWAYHAGDGNGGGMAQHAMEAGTQYIETSVYVDQVGTGNWAVLKFGVNGGAAYDGNGAGILVRSDGSFGWLTAAGSVSWTDPSWTGSLATAPNSAAAAVTIGLKKTGAGTYDLYVNRQKVQSYTGVTNDGGPNVGIAGYNNVGAHFDYVATATDVLTGRP